jgi:transposase
MSDSAAPLSTRAVEGLPEMLLMAYDEVCAVLNSLRQSRDILQKTSVSRLRHTTAKLQEVTDATEEAATGILDGLDRSIGLVDQLEGLDASGNAEAADLRGRLRDELFQAQAALQFQDITAQQLSYAASILIDMEERMEGLARALDARRAGEVGAAGGPEAASAPVVAPLRAFDPNATMDNRVGRQALADEIFTTAS